MTGRADKRTAAFMTMTESKGEQGCVGEVWAVSCTSGRSRSGKRCLACGRSSGADILMVTVQVQLPFYLKEHTSGVRNRRKTVTD